MKKVFSFAVLMMAMCMTLSSCGDDDESDKPVKNAKIEGNWLVSSSRSSSTEKWEDMPESPSVVWSFGEDGTYKMLLKGNATSSGATYKVEGNTVTVTFKDNSYQTLQVYDMANDIEAYIGLYGSDGNLVKFYRIVRCPATAAEVKKMLMAQWKLEAEDEYFADMEYDESYLDFTKDGKEYRFRHYKDYLPSDDPYCKYAGKYVCWSNLDIYDTKITPDEKDLTKGKIYCNKGSNGSNHFFSRLCYRSVILDGYRYTRVETPVKFELMEWSDDDNPV